MNETSEIDPLESGKSKLDDSPDTGQRVFRDAVKSAGRVLRENKNKVRAVSAIGLSLGALVAGDNTPKHELSSSKPEPNTVPISEIPSSSNINGIDLEATTPEEATKNLLERTGENFGEEGKIVPDILYEVIVLEPGALVENKPGNDLLGLSGSAKNSEARRFDIPDKYVLVVDSPWQFSNQAADYLNMTIGDIHAEGRATDPKLNWWLNLISAYKHGKVYLRPGQTGGTVQGGVNSRGNPTFGRTPSNELKAGVLIEKSSLPDFIAQEHLEPFTPPPVG